MLNLTLYYLCSKTGAKRILESSIATLLFFYFVKYFIICLSIKSSELLDSFTFLLKVSLKILCLLIVVIWFIKAILSCFILEISSSIFSIYFFSFSIIFWMLIGISSILSNSSKICSDYSLIKKLIHFYFNSFMYLCMLNSVEKISLFSKYLIISRKCYWI